MPVTLHTINSPGSVDHLKIKMSLSLSQQASDPDLTMKMLRRRLIFAIVFGSTLLIANITLVVSGVTQALYDRLLFDTDNTSIQETIEPCPPEKKLLKNAKEITYPTGGE